MPASTMTGQPFPALDTIDSLNNGVVVFCFRDPRIPVFVDRGEDIERSQDACDGEAQHPDRQVTPGTNPIAGEV